MNIGDLWDAELIDLYCNVADQEELTELEQAVLDEIERRDWISESNHCHDVLVMFSFAHETSHAIRT